MTTRKAFSMPPTAKRDQSVDSDEARRFILDPEGQRVATPEPVSAPTASPAVASPPAPDVRVGPPPSQPSAGSAYPWEEGDMRYQQTFMLRAPEREYLMLKWIAGTTYGESINSLMLDAMRSVIEREASKRGFIVHRDANGRIKDLTKP